MTTVYNKNGIGFDIDAIATDLNGKLDRDCLNVSDTGKIQMANMGMPTDTYEQLTIGASGTIYTAPADGWVNFDIYASGSWIALDSGTIRIISKASGTDTALLLPVAKGQYFAIAYDGTATATYHKGLRFIYAIGSESEAS